MTVEEAPTTGVPTAAGIFLGLGLGGFFDGIVLHQLLQWHHLASRCVPPDSLEALRFNLLLDGLFRTLAYVFVAGASRSSGGLHAGDTFGGRQALSSERSSWASGSSTWRRGW